jgi:hypothetical protein
MTRAPTSNNVDTNHAMAMNACNSRVRQSNPTNASIIMTFAYRIFRRSKVTLNDPHVVDHDATKQQIT